MNTKELEIKYTENAYISKICKCNYCDIEYKLPLKSQADYEEKKSMSMDKFCYSCLIYLKEDVYFIEPNEI